MRRLVGRVAAFAAFALIFVTATASAQEEPDDARSYRVDTSTRAPADDFVDDRATTIVDDEEIARKQATSTTEALEGEPGIFIQSTNRGAGTLFLRGLVGPENLIYVDGVRFNQSTFRTGPNQYLNTFDPGALGRIEVVRGPGSVLFGGGAMGGVVHLIPQRLELQPTAQASLRGETADSSYGASASGMTDIEPYGWRFGAGATILRRGDLRIGSYGGDEIVVSNLDGDEVVPADFDTYYWRARAAYDHTADTRVRLDYFGSAISDAPRTDRIGDGEIRFYDNRDDLIYLTFEHDGEGWLDELRWNVSYHRTSERVDRYNCGRIDLEFGSRTPDPLGCARLQPELVERRRVNNDVVDTYGTSVAMASQLPADITLNYGFETYGDYVRSARADGQGLTGDLEPRNRGNFATGSQYNTLGVYASGAWEALSLGEHDFVLRLGGRAENFNAFAPSVSDEIGDVEFDESGIVGHAGLSYFWGARLHTYLTWNQGFRAPNLQETTVLGDTGNSYEVPNPDLGPERSDTFELGTKVAVNDWFELDGAAFVSYLSDRITREETTFEGESELNGKSVEWRVNRDSAYFYGAELAAETAPIVWDVHLFGNVAYYDGGIETDAEDAAFDPGPLHDTLTPEGTFYSNPRRLPPVRWTAGTTWTPTPAWYLTLWATGASEQDKLASGDRGDLRICEESVGITYEDLGVECPGSAGWATLNVRGGWRHENLTADLAFENVTDRRYRMHGSGYPAAGFNVLATITYRTF